MLENKTMEKTEGCEQKNDDVDVVDSREESSSAVSSDIDFSNQAVLAPSGEKNKSNEVQEIIQESKDIVQGETPKESEDDECTESEWDPINPLAVGESDILENTMNENGLLKAALTKINAQYIQLQTVLSQRESMVELQQKELTLLESEKLSIKRDFESAKREKETAVVRFAMIEKTIIDLSAAKDLATRKLKDSAKEVELLTKRIKIVSGERDKAQKDHRDSIRECESLKGELQMYESKNKYSQVRIKQEVTAKLALETKLGELTQQLNQIKEEQKNRMDSERKSEQEQGAQVILLKHITEEKEKEIIGIQKKLSELTTEFDDLSDKYNMLVVDHEYDKIERARLQDKVTELESTIQQENVLQEELKIKLTEFEAKCEFLTKENSQLSESLNQLKETQDDFNDQSEEMINVRAREDELLGLMKDMTEKCVVVENQLILSNSKSSALLLENEKIKREFEARNNAIKELDDQLVSAKLKRNEEARVFGRLLTEKKEHCDRLKMELDNAEGELVTQKKKHTQVVKELTRELVALRSSNESSPKSTKSSNGGVKSDSDAASQNASPCSGDNGEDSESGPTKKALIQRIARLQVVLSKQTEKIEFLENHCIGLTNELRAKS